jgi:hypothetical protein
MRKLVALFLICVPLQAFGEVMHYSKCKTNEGKTIADVQAWLKDWRALAKKKGIDYRVRILVPHADAQMKADEFFIEGASSTLESHAKAWQWWYTDADAAASNKQLTGAAACDSGAVYRSTD